jgi:hypothetical protein
MSAIVVPAPSLHGNAATNPTCARAAPQKQSSAQTTRMIIEGSMVGLAARF